jgi:translation initiation factor 3 subunit B
VSVWSVQGRKVVKTMTLEQRQANALFWSPSGSHLLLAGLGSMNGQLEWVDVDAEESLAISEHFMANEVEWDPSGRYLLSAVTQPIGEGNWRFTMDNGYRLWSMQGQLLATVPLEQAYQVLWRPRPKGILTKEHIQVSTTPAALQLTVSP